MDVTLSTLTGFAAGCIGLYSFVPQVESRYGRAWPRPCPGRTPFDLIAMIVSDPETWKH